MGVEAAGDRTEEVVKEGVAENVILESRLRQSSEHPGKSRRDM